VSYVAQLGGRLRHFDRPTLESLAARQIATRSHDLDSLAKLEAAAKHGPGAPEGAAVTAPFAITRKTHPAAWHAWTAYCQPFSQPSANPERQRLFALGKWLRERPDDPNYVPSEFPPASSVAAQQHRRPEPSGSSSEHG